MPRGDKVMCSMVFSPNDSPLAGREGSHLTGSKIGERLANEAATSVSLRVIPVKGGGEAFEVQARGELQLGLLIGVSPCCDVRLTAPGVLSEALGRICSSQSDLLFCRGRFGSVHAQPCEMPYTSTPGLQSGALRVARAGKVQSSRSSCHWSLVSQSWGHHGSVAIAENMRREGFELSVSPPRVVFKEEDGRRQEPLEEVICEVDDDQMGSVIEVRPAGLPRLSLP